MNSRTTDRFRKAFADLPKRIQTQSRAAYRLFRQNPLHPSLRFKRVHPVLSVYSVRINLDYRAVGVRRETGMVWFWIGTHSEYDTLLENL
jgi:hypothetical protein